MARVQLFLCFTILFASVTLLDIVSATLNIKPDLPQTEDPQTVKDVEPYTVKVVMVFVTDLEKECPQTDKFKEFFEKLRAFTKYVCPIKKKDEKDYDRDMKAKAGRLFQAISSFAVEKELKKELKEEKTEAINTFKFMKSLAGKIVGGHKKEETEESMKLTPEQQKEIKEGILKWEIAITQIANTMVLSTTNSSSTSGQGSSSSTSGTSFKDTTGAMSNFGSPSGSPSESPIGSPSSSSSVQTPRGSPIGSPSGSPSESPIGSSSSSRSVQTPRGSPIGSTSGSPSGTYFTDTTGARPITSSGSPTQSPSPSSSTNVEARGGSLAPTAGESGSSISSSVSASQNTSTTMTEVETETSKEIMTFIMDLEKKSPPKEEYKSFFEKLKATMDAHSKFSSTEEKKGFFSGLKSVAEGKISDAMTFISSRTESKSAEAKKSLETYQGEVMKAVQELDAIHGKILSQNNGKKDGSVTVTAEQRTEIKQTITKWEQVTTQFVETAVQSEAQSSSSASIDKIKLN